MRMLAVSAMALAMLATPALAQDAAPFEGFHIDGVIGWDHVTDGTDKESGAVYGGAIGYDHQSSKFVIGIEAEGLFSSTNRCVSGACVEAGRDLYVGGRIGGAASDRVMVYLKAGYTNARVVGTLNGTVMGTDDLDGARVGIGAEFALGGNLSVRTEYRYSDYEQNVSRSQVVLGVGFRF